MGRTDQRYQIAYATDAKILTNWAIKKNIGGLYTWSLNRDISKFARDDYSKQIDKDYGPGYTPDMHIYTQPLTIDQLMNYKQSGISKTINIDGQDYDINAAMTNSIGTKDFVYTNIINNFSSKTPYVLNNKII